MENNLVYDIRVGDEVTINAKLAGNRDTWNQQEEAQIGQTYIVSSLHVPKGKGIPHAQLEGVHSSYPISILEVRREV